MLLLTFFCHFGELLVRATGKEQGCKLNLFPCFKLPLDLVCVTIWQKRVTWKCRGHLLFIEHCFMLTPSLFDSESEKWSYLITKWSLVRGGAKSRRRSRKTDDRKTSQNICNLGNAAEWERERESLSRLALGWHLRNGFSQLHACFA